ncbi:hypothetical protein [Crenothrix polyspora]|uniref:Amidohydrolase 2 n=1 Tax=Crenothrix polyspora TaxID=360316 RepID=A0A1R4HCD1_9GAMM
MTQLKYSRRHFLQLAATGLISYSSSAPALFRLANACLDPLKTPTTALETLAWQGINPVNYWDCHTHIVGSGDGGSGITMSADMNAPLLHPIQTIQHWAYANAACTGNSGGQDIAFVKRLLALLETLPQGAKAMLYAFDKAHGANGDANHANTSFFVPNDYAMSLAQRYPERFEWVASIHPYRHDCVRVLEQAAAGGARSVSVLQLSSSIELK